MRQRDHLIELDGLRGLAVIGVLIAHFGVSYLWIVPVHIASNGVDLFFALSGFLITRIRLFEQSNDIGLSEFWIKRVTRIFPAAYLCLLVIGMTYGWSPHLIMAGLYLQTFDPAMFSGHVDLPIGHFWTLSVEEQFYLLWPIVLLAPLRVATASIAILCGVSIALLSLIGVASAMTHEHGALFGMLDHQLFTRGWPIMAGSLIAIYEEVFRKYPKYLLLLGAMAAMVGLAFGAAFFVLVKASDFKVREFREMCGQFLALWLFLWTLYAAYCRVVTPFRIDALRWCGSISYGLYLYHLPIYVAWNAMENKEKWPIIVAITFLTATVSYYCYERPIINWGRRLAKARREVKCARSINEKQGMPSVTVP